MSTIVKVAEEHVEGKPATWVEKGELQLDQYYLDFLTVVWFGSPGMA